MTNADYANDLALLTNTPARFESLLHSQEQAAGGNGLYKKTNKTEFMYFKQGRAISTLSGKNLKLVDQFTFLRNNI